MVDCSVSTRKHSSRMVVDCTYGEVQCIMDDDHVGVPLLPVYRMNDGQTRLKTLPSRNFVVGRYIKLD